MRAAPKRCAGSDVRGGAPRCRPARTRRSPARSCRSSVAAVRPGRVPPAPAAQPRASCSASAPSPDRPCRPSRATWIARTGTCRGSGRRPRRRSDRRPTRTAAIRASSVTASWPLDVFAALALRPSAASVCGPTMPSTASPCARWKRAHGAAGLRAVDAVGRDAERALHAPRRRRRGTTVAWRRRRRRLGHRAAAGERRAEHGEAGAAAAHAPQPRAAAARRARERRLGSSQGRDGTDQLSARMNLAGHHAYGVSCRARAVDLRYAALWRRFAPGAWAPLGPPLPSAPWRRGLGWFHCKRESIRPPRTE